MGSLLQPVKNGECQDSVYQRALSRQLMWIQPTADRSPLVAGAVALRLDGFVLNTRCGRTIVVQDSPDDITGGEVDHG